MTISTRTRSSLVALAFGILAVSSLLFFKTPLFAYGGFFLLGLVGLISGQRLFERTATPEEKRIDIGERVRNPSP